MNTPTIQPAIIEKLKKDHELWLQNPTTQQAILLLKKHSENYKKKLQSDVLVDSNEEKQDHDRAAMVTALTCSIIISDTQTFVKTSLDNYQS